MVGAALGPGLALGLGRADSPWYPSARLFRQERRGDWEPVFQRIADELARELAEGVFPDKGLVLSGA